MININEYLLSKNNKNLHDMPEKGKIAYDWNDTPFTIIDFRYKTDSDFDKFVEKFDGSGWINDDELSEIDEDTPLVATRSKDYNVTEIFVWDESSGLHYK